MKKLLQRLKGLGKFGHRINQADCELIDQILVKIAHLDQKVAGYEALIQKCGEQFRFYEKNHREKAGILESVAMNGGFTDQSAESVLKKAEVNAAMAELCEGAIKK
jgi:hypothetical protein